MDSYIESFFTGLGREERRRALGWYVTGLLLDGERKSIEPIAARLVESADEIEAMRQRLQQAVSVATWSETEVYRRLALRLESELPGVEALVFDDTGFPKKGTHSVGVARQYSGTLGRVDNCQVATSLHLAGQAGSGCIGMRLYLPEEWTKDRERCAAVGVPENLEFIPKWKIALDLVDAAISWGVHKHVVLGDAAYGDVTEFRKELTKRDLKYLLAVQGTLVVWESGTGPKPPPPRKPGRSGRMPTKYTDGKQAPVSIEALAKKIGRRAYAKVKWREGARGVQSSYFAAVRVRTAHRHTHGEPPSEEQWLLCEWPKNEPQPTKSYLSTLSDRTPIKKLVRFAKLRWRIERDYQEMKGEVGLDHFEGRTWRGFHHHAALCAVAHGFLALRRALSPPEDCTVDAPNSPTRPAAGAAEEDRDVPALSPAIRAAGGRCGGLAYVIG
ncbi:IS701 family transposase [Microbacterium sp.]|uniref:IS701 family transposase n=1 Tax=Microbacterium sp. TaxID=51671 RepID=UPI0027369995|nr:IS701 family transposase [Microbacterium sp.]MDP3951331.1 IS701 family transposase [Microbacterium sp.]